MKNEKYQSLVIEAIVFDLSLFENVVVPENAATNMHTTQSENLSPEFKTASYEKFLRMHKANLVYQQLAKVVEIPKHKGMSIEFYEKVHIDPVLTPIVEGMTPDPNKFTIKAKTATLEQFGDWVLFSDVALGTSLHDLVNAVRDPQGYQSARTKNLLQRNALVKTTKVAFASSIVDGVETEVTSQKTLTGDCKLTVREVKKMVARLRRNNVPPAIGEDYVMVIHPDTEFDLTEDPEWKEQNKYINNENMLNGQVGRISGMRFLSSSDTLITKGGTNDPTGLAVYHNLVFGAEAFGAVDLEGEGTQHIAKGLGSGGTADPLNQRATVGWKFMATTPILDELGVWDLMTTSSFSKTAIAN